MSFPLDFFCRRREEKTRLSLPESVQKVIPLEIQNIFIKFFDYVNRNKNLTLEDFYFFCVSSREKVRSVTKEIESFYSSTIEELREKKENFNKQGAEVKIEINNQEGFFHFYINGSIDPNKQIGRIYFNLKPNEKFFTFLILLVVELMRRRAKAYLKIPDQNSFPRMINRSDKVVLYFNSEELDKILEVISSIYEENFFEEEIPLFSLPIRDKRGELKGIGFGEEPQGGITTQLGRSFSTVRAQILYELYNWMRNNRFDFRRASEEDWKNFWDEFGRICRKYGIDPQNPAFNLVESEFKKTLRVLKKE